MDKIHFISILPLLVSIFWTIVMIADKDKGSRRTLMITIFVYQSIIYFCYAVFYNHLYNLYGIVDSLWVFASLMLYPMLYIYIRVMTTRDKLEWHWGWYALPAFLITVISFTIYLLMTPEEVTAYVRGVLYKQQEYEMDTLLVRLQVMRKYVVQILYMIQIVAVVVAGFYLIIRYNNKLQHYYSDLSGKSLKQIKLVLVVIVMLSALSSITNLLGKSFFIQHKYLLALTSVSFAAAVLFMGAVLSKQNFGVEQFVEEEKAHLYLLGNKNKPVSRVPELKNASVPHGDSLKNQIDYLLEVEKIFTYQSLKISDLSHLLQTNHTYIADTIRKEHNTNFCSLVNKHRVNYAKKLLIDQNISYWSMNEVASKAGFSNKSTFLRVFKKKTGVSPNKYQRQHV